jgi:hypothetical protein
VREKVHIVTDYFDGPVRGVADFNGKPHAFELVFNKERDDCERDEDDLGLYLVIPIDDATMQLVLEYWEIWKRWSRAFDSGQTTAETHPALAEDRARHAEIIEMLKPRLEIDSTTAVKVRGRFKAASLLKFVRGLSTEIPTVEWLEAEIH